MSRTYYAICMDHTPVLELNRDFNHLEEIETALEKRSDFFPEHLTCDLLIGELSGGLSAIYCPNSFKSPIKTRCRHSVAIEGKAQWLKLLLAAYRASPQLDEATERFRSGCWTWNRVLKLHTILEPK